MRRCDAGGAAVSWKAGDHDATESRGYCALFETIHTITQRLPKADRRHRQRLGVPGIGTAGLAEVGGHGRWPLIAPMESEPTGSVLDIFVFHSLRLTTEAWYAIAEHYDRFLNAAVDRERRPGIWGPVDRPNAAMPQATQGVFDPQVHNILAEPLPHRVSRRVDRYQHVDQFGLDSFADVGGLRLTARSYSLAVNNHKQCMLILHFSFATAADGIRMDEVTLAEVLRDAGYDQTMIDRVGVLRL